MNKLLVTASACLLFVYSSSCKKKYCYDCTTTRTEILMPENVVVKSEKTTTVHCDHTPESIKVVEENGTKHTTFNKGGKVYQEQMNTTCVPY